MSCKLAEASQLQRQRSTVSTTPEFHSSTMCVFRHRPALLTQTESSDRSEASAASGRTRAIGSRWETVAMDEAR